MFGFGWRPPEGTETRPTVIETLRRFALHVLDWAAMAHAHPAWFGSDGVHPSMTGRRARAAATARLVRAAC
jgi:lysophospholipase L1-like esterase